MDKKLIGTQIRLSNKIARRRFMFLSECYEMRYSKFLEFMIFKFTEYRECVEFQKQKIKSQELEIATLRKKLSTLVE